jgi:hypothetical protein
VWELALEELAAPAPGESEQGSDLVSGCEHLDGILGKAHRHSPVFHYPEDLLPLAGCDAFEADRRV